MWAWWAKWFGTGTADDWRNPFWRWTESRKIKVSAALTRSDIRIGYRRKGDNKWVWFSRRKNMPWVEGVDANFYNGILTQNRTITIDDKGIAHGRFNLVFRPCNSFWFAWGVGILPDRGEWGWTGPWVFGYQSQLKHNPGCIMQGWNEGSV